MPLVPVLLQQSEGKGLRVTLQAAGPSQVPEMSMLREELIPNVLEAELRLEYQMLRAAD